MIEKTSVNLNKNLPTETFYDNDISDKEYYPNELTRKVIEEAERGIGLSQTYDTIEELMKDLMKDLMDDA